MAACLLLAVACGGAPRDAGPAAGASDGAPASAGSAEISPAGQTSRRPTKVLTVVEENKSAASALRSMPWLAGQARSYGSTTSYTALTHPSLPNYLALAGGSTFGVGDDAEPAAHPISGPSVFDTALAAHATAKSYVEAMPANCALSTSGTYPVKHNPWAYFSDPASRANCRRYDVPAGTTRSGALRSDILAGRLPTVGMLIPDICHDAHDCPMRTADDWLRGWMSVITQGPDWKAGRLAVVVTFDEDDYSAHNTVLTAVLAPGVRSVVARTPLTHYSWTRYAGELAKAPPLRGARTAPSLSAGFPGLAAPGPR